MIPTMFALVLASKLTAVLTLAGPARVLTTPPAPGEDSFRISRYELKVEIDPASRQIRGEAAVEIEAAGGAVSEARFSLNRLFKISAVEMNGKKTAASEGAEIAEGREILVSLEPALAKGKRTRLTFRYEGKGLDPGADEADWMGIALVRPDEIRMSHQAQWYPIAPRDDRAMSKHAALTKLELTLPAGMESLGPGNFRGKKPSEGGREIHHWESTSRVQASLLAGKYKAEAIQEGGLSVRLLTFAEHQSGGRAWAREALKALAHLGARFGKSDGSSYGIAEMRVRNPKRSYNYEADGFSVYDGVLFDGRDPDPRKIAHEIAHQWWGGRVDAFGRGERFLTESLAEMSAYLYLEKQYGSEKAEAAAKRWTDRYQNNAGKEDSIAESDFRSPRYSEVIYAKGPLALRALRKRVGAEKFDQGLKLFLKNNTGNAPTLDDFLEAFRDVVGKEVDPWAKEWLESAGPPPSSE